MYIQFFIKKFNDDYEHSQTFNISTNLFLYKIFFQRSKLKNRRTVANAEWLELSNDVGVHGEILEIAKVVGCQKSLQTFVETPVPIGRVLLSYLTTDMGMACFTVVYCMESIVIGLGLSRGESLGDAHVVLPTINGVVGVTIR